MAQPLEFEPWSAGVFSQLEAEYRAGRYTVLDLELSAACALRASGQGCVYCDSPTGHPDPRALDWAATKCFVEQAGRRHYRWIFICGLGEPLDDPRLQDLVEAASSHGLRLMLFTNGVGLTERTVKHFAKNGVCLICKLDSLQPDRFALLLGKGDASHAAEVIVRKVTGLFEGGYPGASNVRAAQRGVTCLAASIVPTTVNYKEIPDIVSYCVSHGVFPLIGQLENAGSARDIFGSLALSKNELLSLRSEVERVLGHEYRIPVCPAAIFGIHVNHLGTIVVDRATGLSCPWFALTEPQLHALGTIETATLEQAEGLVTEYRRGRRSAVLSVLRKMDGHVFGGCGGRQLLQTYVDLESD